jgi:hypothetical protein
MLDARLGLTRAEARHAELLRAAAWAGDGRPAASQ